MKPRIKDQILLPLPNGIEAALSTFTGLSEFSEENISLSFSSKVKTSNPPLVRIHSSCFTGDIFGSLRCDCGLQLRASIEKLSLEGGILVYLKQEGRGIGLLNKITAYALQDNGIDTYQANRILGFKDDQRDYKAAAQILKLLETLQVRLLTNNPLKAKELKLHGIEVIETVPTVYSENQFNKEYLKAKREMKGHKFKSH